MPHRYAYLLWIRFKRLLKKVARSHGSPHDIAVGAAIGFFVGMLPIMGVQMIVAAFIATLAGVSRLAAIVPVWISNPLTFIPLYGFNYWIGHIITGWGPGWDEYEKVLHRVKDIAENPPEGSSFFEGLHHGIVETSRELASQGWGALGALIIGCVLVGLLSALVAYPICQRLVVFIRNRREKKRQERAARISGRL